MNKQKEYLHTINIIVIEANGLQAKSGKHKFFVKLSLQKNKLKSQVVEDVCGNPRFDFEATIGTNCLDDKLKLKLEEKTKNETLGQIQIHLSDLSSRRTFVKDTVTLRPHKKCANPCGRLVFEAWLEGGVARRELTTSVSTESLKSAASLQSGLRKIKNKLTNKPSPSDATATNNLIRTKPTSYSCQDVSTKHQQHQSSSFKLPSFFVTEDNASRMKLFGSRDSLQAVVKSSPAPIITGLSPSVVDADLGGVAVTIRGENLGVDSADVIRLLLCGCDVLSSLKYVSSGKLVCATAPWRPGRGHVVVETKSGGRGVSDVSFEFRREADGCRGNEDALYETADKEFMVEGNIKEVWWPAVDKRSSRISETEVKAAGCNSDGVKSADCDNGRFVIETTDHQNNVLKTTGYHSDVVVKATGYLSDVVVKEADYQPWSAKVVFDTIDEAEETEVDAYSNPFFRDSFVDMIKDGGSNSVELNSASGNDLWWVDAGNVSDLLVGPNQTESQGFVGINGRDYGQPEPSAIDETSLGYKGLYAEPHKTSTDVDLYNRSDLGGGTLLVGSESAVEWRTNENARNSIVDDAGYSTVDGEGRVRGVGDFDFAAAALDRDTPPDLPLRPPPSENKSPPSLWSGEDAEIENAPPIITGINDLTGETSFDRNLTNTLEGTLTNSTEFNPDLTWSNASLIGTAAIPIMPKVADSASTQLDAIRSQSDTALTLNSASRPTVSSSMPNANSTKSILNVTLAWSDLNSESIARTTIVSDNTPTYSTVSPVATASYAIDSSTYVPDRSPIATVANDPTHAYKRSPMATTTQSDTAHEWKNVKISPPPALAGRQTNIDTRTPTATDSAVNPSQNIVVDLELDFQQKQSTKRIRAPPPPPDTAAAPTSDSNRAAAPSTPSPTDHCKPALPIGEIQPIRSTSHLPAPNKPPRTKQELEDEAEAEKKSVVVAMGTVVKETQRQELRLESVKNVIKKLERTLSEKEAVIKELSHSNRVLQDERRMLQGYIEAMVSRALTHCPEILCMDIMNKFDKK